MNNKIEDLKPKHDGGFVIDCNINKVKDILPRISKCQSETSIYLLMIFASLDEDAKMTVPCKQCFIDTAIRGNWFTNSRVVRMINRRSLLVGLITAPAIVRAGLIMPIKVIEPVKMFTLDDYFKMMNKMYLEDYVKKNS